MTKMTVTEAYYFTETIQTAQAQHVTVTTVEGLLPAHADSETLCTEGTELTIELLPHQIALIRDPLEWKDDSD